MNRRYVRAMNNRICTRRALYAALMVCFASATLAAKPDRPDANAVIAHYADMAEAVYGDALNGAQNLSASVDMLIAHPTPENLETARLAWKRARIPYLQTEGFRFASDTNQDWLDEAGLKRLLEDARA